MAGSNAYLIFKQYLKWLPVQLGLFNKGAFLLQINKILPDDIFIVSYPKSGNTWLRFLWVNMFHKTSKINFKTIETFVPDVYVSKEIINSKKEKRVIKTHNTYFQWYPKSIYIYRDYRDVLISFYYYELQLKHFGGSFKEFLQSKNVSEPFGFWKKHVKEALMFKAQHPDRILIISYENLHKNPNAILQSIVNFVGMKPVIELNEVIKNCSFELLRENEKINGSEFKRISGAHFFREGKSNNWKAMFGVDELAILKNDTELVHLMNELGYEI